MKLYMYFLVHLFYTYSQCHSVCSKFLAHRRHDFFKSIKSQFCSTRNKESIQKAFVVKEVNKEKDKSFEWLVHVDPEVTKDNDRPWPRERHGRQGLVHR